MTAAAVLSVAAGAVALGASSTAQVEVVPSPSARLRLPRPVAVVEPPPPADPPAPPPETARDRPDPCLASWYGETHRGRLTASGQPFDPDALTAAAWEWPFGTRLKVTRADGLVSVEVVVTDRGPSKHLGRCVDLSRAAFMQLAALGAGVIEVYIEEVE